MTAAARVHYRVEAADLHAHLYRVTLHIDQPAAQQQVSLPVWIPGSYLIREFSKSLQRLAARQDGRPVALHQLDKCTWQVECVPSSPLVLSYEVYAFDNSVRTAWLDTHRGFFNSTSLCLKVHGQESLVHSLELAPVPSMPNWQAATGLAPHKVGKRGFGTYLATDYDELVDCPVEMGAFWSA
jgi:predicted metalloprotease with PDZ domain